MLVNCTYILLCIPSHDLFIVYESHYAGEELPFEPRAISVRRDKWVTKEFAVSELLGRYVLNYH